ncbi:uncharacterized protein LOC134780331 isoform X1 [Penaeus indicus]|uniref:uncharacterized protein LOC134780331 isoform X1 n=1 Tax=Penaeus indicus TaxID=29960 RepID=UPI00300C0827
MMAGEETHVSSAPTMLFLSIVIGATILVLAWLIRLSRSQTSNTAEKQSKPKRKEPQAAKKPPPPKPQKQSKAQKKPAVTQYTHQELITTLKGHTGSITGGSFSSDGKHFKTAADVGSGRRFDPGGRSGKASCNANLFSIEDSLDLSSISDGSSSLEEVDTSSVSSSSQMANSNAPSDTEEVIMVCNPSKMSRRQRKNKNKRAKMNRVGSSAGRSTSTKAISQSTKTLFDSLEKTEEQLYDLLVPKCCVLEERVLNGYPYATNHGLYIFKPNGYTTLAGVLNGCELLEIELDATEREDLHKTLDVESSSDYSEPESLEDLSVGDTYQDDNHESSSGVSSDSKDSEVDIEGNYGNEINSNFSEFRNSTGSMDLNFDSKHATLQNFNKLQQIEKCKRCRKHFSVSENGSDVCEYHPKKMVLRRDGRLHYQCCNRMKGVAGCTQTSYHVFHHFRSGLNGPLEGFVNTKDGSPRIFGLDCEMIFTSKGFELARLTLVCVSGKVVLDLYVKPLGEVFDYNTKFSGITAEHIERAISFTEARERLLRVVPSSSIIIGHSLEGDLAALKLIHRNVIDTALLFKPPPSSPTLNGPLMHKQSLKSLAKRHLGRDIQKGGSHGHDSLEDATAALDLVLNNIKESLFFRSKVAPLPLALQNM